MSEQKKPGTYGNTTEEQNKILNELKSKFEDHIKQHPQRFDDVYLLRFLRARKWDIEKTLEMLLDNVEFIDTEGVETLLETFPKMPYATRLLNYWPMSSHGLDKCGYPVLFERLGLTDPKALMTDVPEPTMTKFHTFQQEVYSHELAQIEKKKKTKNGSRTNPRGRYDRSWLGSYVQTRYGCFISCTDQ